MAEHMHDLPHRPDFPVFGLGPDFDGHRRLGVWNSPEQLYTVSLGHGDPQQSARWLQVETVKKTPRRWIFDGPHIASGPTGFGDAATGLIVALADRGHPDDRSSMRAFLEVELEGTGPEMTPADLGPLWRRGSMDVDGRTVDCWSREVNGVSACVIDMPGVAISLTGPVDWKVAQLVNVVDELDRYV